MRILLVEDEPEYAQGLIDRLDVPGADVTIAGSRETARRLLTEAVFDLVICDLKIPSVDGALDRDTSHGDVIRAELLSRQAHTPLIVHSAFPTVAYLEENFQNPPTEDIYGCNDPYPLLCFVRKDRLPELLEQVATIGGHIRALHDIEVLHASGAVELSAEEERAISILARRHGGRLVRCSEISGGLSGSRVLRAMAYKDDGTLAFAAVAKIADLSRVGDEVDRFESSVRPILPGGVVAQVIDRVLGGAGSTGAVLYGVDDTYDKNLFDTLSESPDGAPAIVDTLRLRMERWLEGAPQTTVPVAEIRRQSIADERLAKLDRLEELRREDFEDRVVTVYECLQHGDLHGANILVRDGRDPILIDFGDVGQAIATLDPVVMASRKGTFAAG